MLILAPGQIQFSVKIQAARGLSGRRIKHCAIAGILLRAFSLRISGQTGTSRQNSSPSPSRDRIISSSFRLRIRLSGSCGKDHGDAVIARFRKRFSACRAVFQKGIRKLRHNADAIAGSAIGVLAGAVFKLFDDLQRVIYCPMRSLSADIDNGADPAGIMLAFLFGESLLMYLFHAFLSLFRCKACAASRYIFSGNANASQYVLVSYTYVFIKRIFIYFSDVYR